MNKGYGPPHPYYFLSLFPNPNRCEKITLFFGFHLAGTCNSALGCLNSKKCVLGTKLAVIWTKMGH